MKLPAKVEYAAKAMVELSKFSSIGKPVAVEASAAAQKIPRKFLLQILLRLGQSGLVKSVRGSGGGYQLARHPSQITLLEVIRGIDNSFVNSKGDPWGTGQNSADYVLQSIWADVNKQTEARLNVSLEDLVLALQDVPITYEI